MSLSRETVERLQSLLTALADDTLAEDERTELESILLDSPEAQEFYVDFVSLNSELGRMHGDRQEAEGRGQESAPSDIHSSPLTPYSSRKSLLNWASRNPKGPAIAVAATLLIAALIVMGLVPVKQWIAGNDRDEDRQRGDTATSDFVAIFNNSHQAKWLDETQPNLSDPRLRIGRRLAISSGMIEVKYYTGARVVIEGPAEFFVGSQASGDQAIRHQEDPSRGRKPAGLANRGFLRLGKLVAIVEGETAQGFAIDTPSGRVEDLGTEFGVEVHENGGSEFVVLSGEVDLIREGHSGLPPERMRLTANQGAFIAKGSDAIVRRDTVDASLLSATRQRLGALASASRASKGLWRIDGTVASESRPSNSTVATTLAEGVSGSDGDAYGASAVGLSSTFFDTHPLAVGAGNQYIRHWNYGKTKVTEFGTGYTEFTVSSKPGFLLSLSSLTFDSARGREGGIRGFEIYGKAEGTPTEDDLLLDVDNEAGTREDPTERKIDLSADAYQGIRSITFRYYPLSNSGSIDFARMQLNGEVISDPGQRRPKERQ